MTRMRSGRAPAFSAPLGEEIVAGDDDVDRPHRGGEPAQPSRRVRPARVVGIAIEHRVVEIEKEPPRRPAEEATPRKATTAAAR